MNKLRSIFLLGTFASAGVALALGIGLSMSAAPAALPRGPGLPGRGLPEGGLPGDTAQTVSPDNPIDQKQPSTQAASESPGAGRSAPATLVRRQETTAEDVARGPVVTLDAPIFALEDRGEDIRSVVPIPAYGQQPSIEAIQETVKHSLQELQRATSAAPTAPPPPPADILASPPPATASPATPSTDSLSGNSARIQDDGNGRLTIFIQNEDIRRVLELLGAHGGINILASPTVQGTVSATLRNVEIEEALDAIVRMNGFRARKDGPFVFIGTPTDFISLEQSFDTIATRIFRPNYITANELQQLIKPLLTEGTGVCSISSAAETGITADSGAAGGNTFAGAEAVVVRDYEAVLAQVDALVADVDVRPLQVHIEAMILSVTLKDDDAYGVNWQFLRDNGNVRIGIGDPAQTLAKFNFEKGALKVGFLDSSLAAFLSALETIGDTNVIASPRLLVLNKQPANIQIGDQKGYISTTVTETVATETVEFMETGTILRIRPFISTDGMVRMEIHPELSKGEVVEKGDFTLPEKQVTEVTTNVMVNDGSTVLIGGLMRDEVAVTKNQIPFFGNLPYVGFVFRTSSESTERQEVLVLITPHIVYEPGLDAEGDHAAAEFHRRQQVAEAKLEPFSRRPTAQRYFRLAQSAWAAGDRKTALRFAEMAVHVFPGYRAAIDLRSDIWLGRPYGDHTLSDPPSMPAGEHPLDGPEVAEWVLDDLRQNPESAPLSLPGPLHPLDPGQPGYSKDVSQPRKLQ